MKKIKNIAAVLLVLTGLGGIVNKSYLGGIVFIAIGALLFILPKKKKVSAAVRPGGLGTRSEITDDYTRVHCAEWIVLDTETTGLGPIDDRIIEIAAVKYKNGEAVDSFVTLVNPGVAIPERITKITGMTDKYLKKAPNPATLPA